LSCFVLLDCCSNTAQSFLSCFVLLWNFVSHFKRTRAGEDTWCWSANGNFWASEGLCNEKRKKVAKGGAPDVIKIKSKRRKLAVHVPRMREK
jgi:hypothetical protein